MATITAAMQQDSSGNNIQITAKFVTEDGTGTPKTSPYTYTTSVTTFVVPDDAYEFVVTPSTGLFISEDVAMTNYDKIDADTKEVFPCIKMTNIYFKGSSSGGTAHFRFHTL